MNGFFVTFFYQPILNLLVFLYNISGDLGIAILLLTIIIKLILFPLSKRSIRSQKALQDIQPEMEKIKAKYKDDKQATSLAIMNLYKENKVNPFSSCLPLLIQLPFLIAIFRVFRDGFAEKHLDLVYSFIHNPGVIEATTLGSISLSERSIVLAILAGLAQFLQVKMMHRKKPPIKTEGSKDENMLAIMNQQMMHVMPIMTVFIGLSFPAGLTFYWLLTTILTIIQQKIVFSGDKTEKKKENKTVIRVIE